MKKQVILSGAIFLLMLFSLQLFAQVGINKDGSQPDPSAMLDVKSQTQGFLPPRIALTSADVSSPVMSPVAVGLLIFNTVTAGIPPNNVAPGYYFWNGGRWIAATIPQGIDPGDMLFWNGVAWVTIPPGEHGQQLSFCNGLPKWGGCDPLVNTGPVTNIYQNSAVAGGEVTSEGGSPVIARGVCWSTFFHPTIADNKTLDGSGMGEFVSNVTGLLPSTTYHLRAYATNSAGTAYGHDTTFQTSVYVGAPVTTAPHLYACSGSTVDVPIAISEFSNIAGVTLKLLYNSTVLTYTGATNNSGFPGLTFSGSESGVITVTGAATQGVTYPDNTVFFTLHFLYSGGYTDLTWSDNGPSCQYLDGGFNILNDIPTSSYYINGKVDGLIEVGVPVFEAGPTSSRCQGVETVTYTATAQNTSGITYSLDANSLAAGNSIDINTGAVSYTASWSGTSVITASATGCHGPKTSDHTVTINQLLPVSIYITPSANPICAGNMVTFSSTRINGGTAPAYQWKVNGNDVSGATDSTYSYVPENGNEVTCKLTSNALCAIGNPAISNIVIMAVNPVLPVSVSISASADTVCEGDSVIFTAIPVNGGANPIFEWLVNGTNAGSDSSHFNYVPTSNDVVTCILISSESCFTGNPDTSNAVTLTVNPLLPVSVTISASENPACGGTEVTFTAEAVNGGTLPAYQWKVNGDNTGTNSAQFAYVPVNNDVVNCVLTSSLPCVSQNPATSNEVIMNINLLFQVGSISANQDVCGNNVPALLQGIPPLNGTLPVYQWQVSHDNNNFTDIDGATNLDFQPPMLTTTTYYRQMQNASGTCGGPLPTNVVTMAYYQITTASVSISADPAGPVCEGVTVVFTAVPVNGGTSPSYQWKVNGSDVGTDSAIFSYTPANNDIVKCVLTSNQVCVTGNPATSDPINMTVSQVLPVSVTIEASANQVCDGTPVDFTAIPVNGGTNPSFQWKVNGVNAGTNSAMYSYLPMNGDEVMCVLTSSEACKSGDPATSNPIVMIIYQNNPVSVSIGANPTGSVCEGTMVTFTATPTNGGTSPAYQWKVNGTNAGTDSSGFSYIPSNGDAVICVLTSTIACGTGNPATSNTITMTVNPILAVSVSVSPSANPVCSGLSVVFTATPVNGGTSPAYQWKVNGSNVSGATNVTYSYLPDNNDAVSCVLTSNVTCTTGNPATSNTIDMIVNPSTTVGVSLASSIYAVMPGTQVTLTATPVNGGTAPTYQWKVNGSFVSGASNCTYTYTPSNNDRVSAIMTSNYSSSCLSNNPATSNTIGLIVYTTGTACTGIPTVSYGGLTYNTVQIGTQCWLRENINLGNRINNTVAQTNNSITEKYCYNDSSLNCDIYGGLYQWNELMQYVTTAGAQGICPSGWHVPTDAEFSTMVTFLGGITGSGGKLKAVGTTFWRYPNTSATNAYGFTALPSGYSAVNPTNFGGYSRYGYIYTSTQNSSTDAYYYTISYSTAGQNRLLNYKTTATSVRCIKN